MTKTIAALTLAAMIAYSGHGQQVTNSQPTQPQTTPCTPAPKPPKGFHFGIPPKLQQAIDKQRQQIQNKTGQTVPSTDEVKKDLQPKPCPAPGKAQPDNPQKAPPAKPVSPPPQAEFVCPPKATLIPGQPYCIFNDRKVVDAIPLPAGTIADPAKPTQPKS